MNIYLFSRYILRIFIFKKMIPWVSKHGEYMEEFRNRIAHHSALLWKTWTSQIFTITTTTKQEYIGNIVHTVRVKSRYWKLSWLSLFFRENERGRIAGVWGSYLAVAEMTRYESRHLFAGGEGRVTEMSEKWTSTSVQCSISSSKYNDAFPCSPNKHDTERGEKISWKKRTTEYKHTQEKKKNIGSSRPVQCPNPKW